MWFNRPGAVSVLITFLSIAVLAAIYFGNESHWNVKLFNFRDFWFVSLFGTALRHIFLVLRYRNSTSK